MFEFGILGVKRVLHRWDDSLKDLHCWEEFFVVDKVVVAFICTYTFELMVVLRRTRFITVKDFAQVMNKVGPDWLLS